MLWLGHKLAEKLPQVNLCRVDLAQLTRQYNPESHGTAHVDYFESTTPVQNESLKKMINNSLNLLRVRRRRTNRPQDYFRKESTNIDENLTWYAFGIESFSENQIYSHLGLQHEKKPQESCLVFLPVINKADSSVNALYVF